MMDEDDRRRRARELAQARYGFRWHLPIYVLVNVGFVVLWWYTGMGFFWPIFPILFWGFAVLAHYLGAYRTMGHEWIEQETEKILREQEGELGER